MQLTDLLRAMAHNIAASAQAAQQSQPVQQDMSMRRPLRDASNDVNLRINDAIKKFGSASINLPGPKGGYTTVTIGNGSRYPMVQDFNSNGDAISKLRELFNTSYARTKSISPVGYVNWDDYEKALYSGDYGLLPSPYSYLGDSWSRTMWGR